MSLFSRLFLPLALVLALAGCESDEERAERYFESAMSLIAEGDIERAKVELRNVFQHDRFHEGARRAFAEIDLAEDKPAAAYRHYAFIVEEQPENAEIRLLLAEMALDLGNLEEATRHGTVAIELTPDEPRVKVLKAAFDYQAAIDAEDDAARNAAAEDARVLLAEMPDSAVARRVVIDNMLKGDDPLGAMPAVDEALQLDPESYLYNQLKLQLLAQAQDMEAIGAQLRTMVTLFPDDEKLSSDLIRWYVAQGDNAGAEAFLRELAGDPTGPAEGHLNVVQFLRVSQDAAAAQAELDRLAAANEGTPNAELYRALSAGFSFEDGERDAAIATMEEIVAGLPEDRALDEQSLRIKVMLARMLSETGNAVGARAQVEEVLAGDPSNVEALKMRAAWAIQDDDPRTAISDLRTALGQAPRDPQILTLMAEAHQRDGATALAGERLAQAVDVSGSAAPEALRYARFLLDEDRRAAALTVLSDARASNPGNVEILTLLGRELLKQESWVQVQRIVADLDEIATPEAEEAARTLRAALLVGQDRVDESLSYLRDQIASGTASQRTVLQLVELNVRSGDTAAARAALEEALAAAPDDRVLRLADANLSGLEGDDAAAEEKLRAMIADFPEAEEPVRLLYVLLRRTDRVDEASSLMQQAFADMPESVNLGWILASERENAGDYEVAITIYEELYARNSSNTIIANNLASLLTNHRDDAESLARAESIARRLKDADVPAFQDTYGWILYRQGEVEDALPYLEQAAAGLPADPLVQFHYGIALKDAGQAEAAKAQLERALEVAGDNPLPQFDQARAALEELATAGSE